MYHGTSPRKGLRVARKSRSDELGAVLVETVFVFGLMLPILGGMLMVSQISQERTLIGQVLRAATRPVTFHESLDTTAPDDGQQSQLREVQDMVCTVVELSLEAARVPKDRFSFSIERVSESEPNDGITTSFLEITAERKTPMNIPFYGTMKGTATQKTIFPVRLVATNKIVSEQPYECFEGNG